MTKLFKHSAFLDYEVTKQLSHMKANWELTWDNDLSRYEEEEDSFAADINKLIAEIERTEPPTNYHKHEDVLFNYVNEFLKWGIEKKGKRWLTNDYACFLEQGAFHDINEYHLIQSAAGRIQIAKKLGQKHYDEMEDSHRKILGDILAVILFHKECNRC